MINLDLTNKEGARLLTLLHEVMNPDTWLGSKFHDSKRSRTELWELYECRRKLNNIINPVEVPA